MFPFDIAQMIPACPFSMARMVEWVIEQLLIVPLLLETSIPIRSHVGVTADEALVICTFCTIPVDAM